MQIGIGGSYGINYFQDGSLPPSLSPGCDTFRSGRGNGLNLLARLDLPLSESFSFSPVLSYENFSGDHTWGEFGRSNDTSGGTSNLHQVEIDHVISAYTKALGIKALFGWKFFQPLAIEAGPALYYLFDQTYAKAAHAITPGLLLHGDLRDSNESSGSLPNAKNIMAAFSIALSAEFPLSKKLSASPNIEFLLPLTQSTSYWNEQSLRFGVTLKYQLDARQDTITEFHREQIPVRITIPQRKPTLSASIEAVDPQGEKQHVVRLEVEEVRVHYAYPMLNYIFFGEGSAAIPARYNRYASFTEAQKDLSSGHTGLIGLYHQTLNTLGDRLRRSSATHITITGCTSDEGVEAGNISLAKNRAENIKEYLTRVWQIDPKRIQVASRLLPEKPSPSDIPEGNEENRRVEITSSDDALTDPVIVTKTEHISNPPTIFLQPHVYSEAGLAKYYSSISLGPRELVRFLGTEQKSWSVPEEALSSGIDSLDLSLVVNDSAGNSVTAHNAIKLEQRRIEREKQQELEKFSLILFAFDESELGSKNKRTLGLVAESFRKKPAQKLSIVGYTDELGESSHNNELSRRRAAEAKDELMRALTKRGLKFPENTVIDGKGSREKLYDNSLPEGRFFSRTVNITVEHVR
jgi:outer membrane protein OmpA-like peptidoglycan-associated protein